MVDGIPIASQAKSALQWLWGDSEGALTTQENFSKRCLVVSQVRSAVEAYNGDQQAAWDTQAEFLSGLDGIPLVGHAKV